MAKRKKEADPIVNAEPAAPAAKPRRVARPKAVKAKAPDEAVPLSEPLTAPVAELTSVPRPDAMPVARAAAQPRRSGNGSITPDRIASRAYEIYQSRNGSHGDPLQDWLQAERELTGPHAK